MESLAKSSCHHRFLACVASAPVAVIALTILDSWTPDHTPPPLNSASSSHKHFSLEISPDPVSLGVVGSGQKVGASLILTNPGIQPVMVERLETSCPCLTIIPSSIRIGPGDMTTLAVTFDSFSEPGFRGGLSIDIIGHGPSRAILFKTHVNVEVRAESILPAERESTDLTPGLERGAP